MYINTRGLFRPHNSPEMRPWMNNLYFSVSCNHSPTPSLWTTVEVRPFVSKLHPLIYAQWNYLFMYQITSDLPNLVGERCPWQLARLHKSRCIGQHMALNGYANKQWWPRAVLCNLPELTTMKPWGWFTGFKIVDHDEQVWRKTADYLFHHSTWWRHQMETFSASLSLCAGNSPVPVNSPHKGQWRGALMFSLICVWINGWVNNREAGDLRRHRGHYDVIVMTSLIIHNLGNVSIDKFCTLMELIRSSICINLQPDCPIGCIDKTTQRTHGVKNVIMTSKRRRNVVSTSYLRCFHIMCPLGRFEFTGVLFLEPISWESEFKSGSGLVKQGLKD